MAHVFYKWITDIDCYLSNDLDRTNVLWFVLIEWAGLHNTNVFSSYRTQLVSKFEEHTVGVAQAVSELATLFPEVSVLMCKP